MFEEMKREGVPLYVLESGDPLSDFDALAFSSGMAAITAMMELFAPGDHLITDADLYGGSIRLFDNVSKKNGISFSHINCSTEDVESFVQENTKAIFVETPTNPMMNVTDIRKMAEIAKRHGLWLIVDNTFLSPYFQNPLELGADIVIHSGTKFLGGHNDTLSGFVVTNSEEISEKMRFIIKTVGSGLAPMDSWLILRGIKTLPLRMEKAQENAKAIVEYLLTEPKVEKVYYPGIEGSAGYEICKSQARGFGSMLTFEVESRELALHILKHTKLIPFAESLGVAVEFQEIEWNNKILELNGKTIDCVWNGMTITDEVKSAMSVSNAYCKNAQVVVVRSDVADQYQTAEDCKALQFAVESGSAGQEVADENGFSYTEVIDQATALLEVSSGTADAAIIDLLMADAMIGEGTSYENLTYTVGLNDEEYGVGFRKGSDLAEALNKFFAAGYGDGTVQKAAETYKIQAALIKQ